MSDKSDAITFLERSAYNDVFKEILQTVYT